MSANWGIANAQPTSLFKIYRSPLHLGIFFDSHRLDLDAQLAVLFRNIARTVTLNGIQDAVFSRISASPMSWRNISAL